MTTYIVLSCLCHFLNAFSNFGGYSFNPFFSYDFNAIYKNILLLILSFYNGYMQNLILIFTECSFLCKISFHELSESTFKVAFLVLQSSIFSCFHVEVKNIAAYFLSFSCLYSFPICTSSFLYYPLSCSVFVPVPEFLPGVRPCPRKSPGWSVLRVHRP